MGMHPNLLSFTIGVIFTASFYSLNTPPSINREEVLAQESANWTNEIHTSYNSARNVLFVLGANCRVTSAWMNLGYLEPGKEFTSYADAAESLIHHFARIAHLSVKDSFMIDVGFGFGDQDFVFTRDYNVKQILGINVAEKEVEVAKYRAVQLGLSDRIHFFQGDAVRMDHAENSSADVVVAVDSALHFFTRYQFFHRAWHVLKRGGRLAMVDQVVKDPVSLQLYRDSILDGNDTEVPYPNLVLEEEYRAQLEQAGFDHVELHEISDFMYAKHARAPPFVTTVAQIYNTNSIETPFFYANGYEFVRFFVTIAFKY